MEVTPDIAIALAVLLPFLAAALAPLIHRLVGDLSGWVVALVPVAAFIALWPLLERTSTGEVVRVAWPWAPSWGLELSFLIDGLSLVFALTIAGVGAFVLLYSGAYLKGHRQGRFLGFLLAFMGAMQGLVLADNLVALGIVRRFAGQGTVVAEYCDWNMLDPQVTRWLVDHADPNIDFLTEILEFRYAAEPYISAIAAERASARDLMAMEEAHKAMAAAVDPLDGQVADQDVFDDADVAFHAAIYRATHNIVWAQLSHILSPAIRLVIRRTNATADELRDTLERHRLLMECIRLRRPREAFDAAIHVMNRTAVDLGSSGRQTHRDLIDLMRRQVEADLRSAP